MRRRSGALLTASTHAFERNVRIPNGDGAEMAADLYLPATPGPHPALVSLYPYRKDDVKGANGSFAIRYLVEQGYAHVLADLPGLGSSTGSASDAMSYDQARDGAAIVEWTAAQPWCDGNVGMWGISYGGITSFQTASVRPPHLRAIVPIYATSDVYADWFYPGGCFNCLGVSMWAAQMLAMQLAPPMFHDPDGRWERVWRTRLEQADPYALPWQDHPVRDDFWKSKAIPLDAISAPTFLIGGWRDIFPEAMARAYQQISAPRKLWMGPWTHISPDSSPTAPVDYLPQMVRWFDRFLRDDRNGIDEEPPVTLYVQGGAARWKNEREWPIARATEQTLFFGRDGILNGRRTGEEEEEEEEEEISYECDPTLGLQAGLWDARGTGLGVPLDQGPDDLRSVAFTTEPLPAGVEITGSPVATVTLAVDEGDDVNLVVKLCDVSPLGGSELITTGWLKVSHRVSHESAEAPPAGEHVAAEVSLWATSYEVAAGHRIRVSISCADFPRIWPTTTNPRIRIVTGGERGGRIRLPVIPPASVDGALPAPADPAEDRAPLTHDFMPAWRIERDLVHGAVAVVSGDRAVLTTPGGDGTVTFDIGLRAGIARHAPHEAAVTGVTRVELEMPSGQSALVVAETEIRLDGIALTGRVSVDGSRTFEKSWRRPDKPGERL